MADSIYRFTCGKCGRPWEVCRQSAANGYLVKKSSADVEACPHCGNTAGHHYIHLRTATAGDVADRNLAAGGLADKAPRTPMDALLAALDDMTTMLKDTTKQKELNACFVDGKLVDRDRFHQLVSETVRKRIPGFEPSDWAEGVELMLLSQAARGESPDGGEAVDKD